MRSKTFIAPLMAALVAGCAAGPKPKALGDAERLLVSQDATTLKRERPKLIAEAEDLLRRAKEAHADGDTEQATLLAHAAASRYRMAHDLVASAGARARAERLRAATPESADLESDRFDALDRRIDTLIDQLAERRADPAGFTAAREALLAARSKQAAAIAADTPRTAPTTYAKGASHIVTAVEALELEIYTATVRESQQAETAFEAAMREANQPVAVGDDDSGRGGAVESLARARAAQARASAVPGADTTPDYAAGLSLLAAAEASLDAEQLGETKALARDARARFEAASKFKPAVGATAPAASASLQQQTEDLLVSLRFRRAELIGRGLNTACGPAFGEFEAIVTLAEERLAKRDTMRAWEFAIRAQERIRRCESQTGVIAAPAETGAAAAAALAKQEAAAAIREAQGELAAARGRAPNAAVLREGEQLLASAERWFDRESYREASQLARDAGARLRSAVAVAATPEPTSTIESPAERRAKTAVAAAEKAQLDALERQVAPAELTAADRLLEGANRALDQKDFDRAARLAAQAKGAYDALGRGKDPVATDCNAVTLRRAKVKAPPPADAASKDVALLLTLVDEELRAKRCDRALALLEQVERTLDPRAAATPGDAPPTPKPGQKSGQPPWKAAHEALEEAVEAREAARPGTRHPRGAKTFNLGVKALERAEKAYGEQRYDDAAMAARRATVTFRRVDLKPPSTDLGDNEPVAVKSPTKPSSPDQPDQPDDPDDPEAADDGADSGTADDAADAGKVVSTLQPWREPYYVVYRALELRDRALPLADEEHEQARHAEGVTALSAARTSWEDRAYRRAEVQARTAIGHFRAIIDGIPAPQPTTDTPEPMPTSSVTREDADAALREARVVKQLCERDQCAERDFEALTRANEAIVSAESSFAAGNYAHSQGLAKDATEKLNAILAKPRKDKPAPPTVDPEVKNAARDAVANAEIQQKLCESRGCEKIDLEAWLLAQKDLSAAKSAVADGDFERASRLAASADNAYRAIKQSAPTFVIPADASGITRSGDQLFVAPALSFASGSSQLSAASRPSLQALAKVLIANQDQLRGVRIVGYTDNSGSAQLNERISAKRAEAVRNALVALGVPAAMLTSEGRGPADPIADNSTAAGREANRRVEVRFTLKGDQS